MYVYINTHDLTQRMDYNDFDVKYRGTTIPLGGDNGMINT